MISRSVHIAANDSIDFLVKILTTWDGGEVQEGGDICIFMANSH